MIRYVIAGTALAAWAAGCAPATHGNATSTAPHPTAVSPAAAAADTQITKILVIPEENHSYNQIIGAKDAPFITALSRTYGLATHYVAGDPASYHSLPSYLMMTEGTTGVGVHGSDCSPADCPQPGDNLFHQAQVAGKRWGIYAESMPKPCDKSAVVGAYAARHAPAPYYSDLGTTCAANDVPMGSSAGGALSTDIAGGRLPNYAMAVPNLNNDMHDGTVGQGDRWLSAWLPKILRGADYRTGRLAVVLTWDEGGGGDNHIATIVIAPRAQQVTSAVRYTHYSLLRTCEEILHLPLLGAARNATSMRAAFHL